MRYLILALMLFALPAHALGPLAAATAKKAGNYQQTGFESNTLEGWTKLAGDGTTPTTDPHTGTRSYYSGALYVGNDDYLEKTITCATGTIDVWIKGTPSQKIKILVDGGTVLNTTDLTTEWARYSGAVTAGSRTIRLLLTGTGGGGRVYLDDISVPIP
jgi:hypothetical protein